MDPIRRITILSCIVLSSICPDPVLIGGRGAAQERAVTHSNREESLMRTSHWVFLLVAVCGLLLGGCGKPDTAPPPDVVTETPELEIDFGAQVSPDDLGKKRDVDGKIDVTPDG